jgi:hypothetical protein
MKVRRFIIGVVGAIVVTSGAEAAQTPSAVPDSEQVRARQRIFMMEGVLERAVQLGVDNLRRRARSVMPDDALVQGSAPQVRGFRLEGYGVFFDVEVPSLRRSIAWSLRMMNETTMALARDLAAMRAFVQAIEDPRARAEYERVLQRVQRQVAPPRMQNPSAPDRVTAQAGAGATVAAQTVGPPQARALPSAPEPAPAIPVDATLLSDPSEAYTQEVKASLIDAMIENSGAVVLGADEWLTVAARDNAPTDPLMPGDQMTLVLRVKGSDINAFRAGRLTLEQVRARVQAGEF